MHHDWITSEDYEELEREVNRLRASFEENTKVRFDLVNEKQALCDRITELDRALRDCYQLARRKRATTHRYHGCRETIQGEPRSNDADWDHIIRFCEKAGLRSSILREGGE